MSSRPRLAVVIGTALILGAYAALIATGPPMDVWRGMLTGAAILGAALIIRTIGPSSHR